MKNVDREVLVDFEETKRKYRKCTHTKLKSVGSMSHIPMTWRKWRRQKVGADTGKG